jgi:hypothetical protein
MHQQNEGAYITACEQKVKDIQSNTVNDWERVTVAATILILVIILLRHE